MGRHPSPDRKKLESDYADVRRQVVREVMVSMARKWLERYGGEVQQVEEEFVVKMVRKK